MTIHPHVSFPSAERPFRAPRWERRHTAAWGALTILVALIIGGWMWFDMGHVEDASVANAIAAPQTPAASR